MGGKLTRREALVGVSSALMLQSSCSSSVIAPDLNSAHVFRHGVASGDPDTHSVVIWTRISDVKGTATVTWQVALEQTFSAVVNEGQVETNASRDYTVKAVVDNLQPGTQYFYRFIVARTASLVGMTRTLPAGAVDRVVLAVTTCSNYAFGNFNAYDVIARDPDVDCVIHLGDYIYEHGGDAYGGESGRRLGREHMPAHETVTLADYRQRHAQYKTDPASLLMHARHPLIAIWDDHESANNPWMGGAQNHQPDEGIWERRRTASLQAYFEWMPVRDPANVAERAELWRHYKWGDLASLITLECRHTGRSEQVNYDEYIDGITNTEQRREFLAEVVGESGRSMLSADMEHFLHDGLAEAVDSGRRWRVIGNQSVMAKRWAPDLRTPEFEQLKVRMGANESRAFETMAKLGDWQLLNDLDSWNGYPEARERLYALAKDAGATDLLVLSGDSHSYWSNVLFDAEGNSMGVELGTTAVTSPGWPFPQMAEAQRLYDTLQSAHNKEIMWADARHKGFIRLELRTNDARADYITVSDIESRQFDVNVVRTVKISNHNGSLRFG